MRKHKVYLDTAILSRLTDLRITNKTAQAFASLAVRQDIEWVTSQWTLDELRRTPNTKRAGAVAMTWALITKLPYKTLIATPSRIIGGPISVGPSIDPLYASLCGIFDRGDAEHVYHAAASGCDYFLTLDQETIMSRAAAESDALGLLCPTLSFRNPEGLLRDLTANRQI